MMPKRQAAVHIIAIQKSCSISFSFARNAYCMSSLSTKESLEEWDKQ